MKEFILRSRQFYDPDTTEACRICEMIGRAAKVTHCVEAAGLNDDILFELSCEAHIQSALNDTLAKASAAWRVYMPPTERVHSDGVHTTAADLLKLCTLLRRLEVADRLRALALQVHKAARYLEHYENMNGGHDDE